MPNRLASETSPYLQEHAENPVDWYPWGDEALARARRDNKPILLSIGYSACHWCHVMARESFEDPEIAALMNRDFVSIKVDREERPDLDQIYMRAVQAMTGSGGWPMTVFLLPDQTPFFAGTYFPPNDRYGMPGFRRVLATVSEAFSQRPAEVERTASRVRDFLRSPGVRLDTGVLAPALLDTAYEHLARDYDPADGGFGGAPKFPQAMAIEFLLRTYVRRGSLPAKDMATRTLQSMAEGGIYDQLGGGFHRYAVDAHWLVPHFEKMLYDNALLLRVYLDAWQLTGMAAFRRVAEETISFALREMRSPEGGFYSSLDADSEGEEGLFYLWTPRELEAVLGPADATAVAQDFGVSDAGNFEGRNILHALTPEAPAVLDRARDRLMAARSQRARPHRDEKVLAGWNGLMLRALAEAGRVLDRADLVSVARENARFLLSRMRESGRMRRSYKDGRAPLPGFLEDQASVADGLLSLYEATFDRAWLDELQVMIRVMLSAFWDDDRASFFDTAADQEQLVARPQDFTDNAIPSGTSLAVDVLLRGGMLLGEDTWVAKARTVLEALGPTAARAPLAFGRLLAALDFELGKPVELAFIGEPSASAWKALVEVARGRYLPNHLIAADSADGNNHQIPLLAGRTPIGGQPTAYLCEGFVCQAPTSDPAELARQLDRATATSVTS